MFSSTGVVSGLHNHTLILCTTTSLWPCGVTIEVLLLYLPGGVTIEVLQYLCTTMGWCHYRGVAAVLACNVLPMRWCHYGSRGVTIEVLLLPAMYRYGVVSLWVPWCHYRGVAAVYACNVPLWGGVTMGPVVSL